jgi:hypothetical protein
MITPDCALLEFDLVTLRAPLGQMARLPVRIANLVDVMGSMADSLTKTRRLTMSEAAPSDRRPP